MNSNISLKSLYTKTKVLISTAALSCCVLVISLSISLISSRDIFTTEFASTITAPTLSVDASTVVNQFSSMMRGQDYVNWMHIKNWGKPFLSQVPNLINATKAMKPGIIRYAGGIWSDYVGWFRQPQSAGAVAPYSYNYGTDEIDDLGAFSNAVGSDVMIEVNVTNDNPQMWADLVKYANIEHNYKFKYWELGNEYDLLCYQKNSACLTPDQYVQRFQEYKAAMTAIDPSIKIMGPTAASAAQAPFDPVAPFGPSTAISDYITKLVQNGNPDGISWHWYQQYNDENPSDLSIYTFKDASGNPIDPTKWNNQYSRSWAAIEPARIKNEVIGNKNILQGVSEINFDAGDWNNTGNPLDANQYNAVWLADDLGRLAYNGANFASIWEGYSTQYYAPIYPNNDVGPSSIYVRPSYYPYYMYANYFGDQLVTSTSSDPDQQVSIWASKDTKDPNKLKIMISNFNTSSVSTPLNLYNFSPSSAQEYVLSSTNPTDMSANSVTENSGTNINGVQLKGMTLGTSNQQPIVGQNISITNNSTINLAPLSVTSLVISGSFGTTTTSTTPIATTTPITTSSPVSTTTATTTAVAESPYKSTTLPATVYPSNYDFGGEGIAYHDADATNLGGQYRNDGVDIETSSDPQSNGNDVGWTQTGEWEKYSVNVSTSGAYTADFRVASSGQGGIFHLESDGVDITGPQTVPNTGGWQNYTDIQKSGINLTTGSHILRLVMDQQSSTTNAIGNFSAMIFTLPSTTVLTTTPVATTTATVSPASGCVCQSNNICSNTCTFTKDPTVTYYSSTVSCIRESSLGAAPNTTDQNSYCNRVKRLIGDADGSGTVDNIDYFYYVRAVNGGLIPSSVFPDFDGNGIISPSDRQIVIQNLGK